MKMYNKYKIIKK